jgi:dolichol-phosphate mannosyltransferase
VDRYAGTLEFPVELVFVNDGSTDRTEEILGEYVFEHIEKARLVSLSKNFGSHAAIRAGLTQASHGICTWIGSDLQEPLEFLQMSWDRIAEGYNAVYIEKRSVEVSSANRSFSRVYSYLMRKYAVSSYASGGISTIVFDRKIMDYVNGNQESNSSIMLQIMDAGFRSSLLSLDFNSRYAGESKWTLKKKIKLFIDSFVSFSFMPIRLVSIVGIVMFVLGLVMALFTFVNKLINPAVPIGYSTIASILALGFGVTNISLGILAEYLWRTYDAARARPPYIVSDAERLDADAEEE